MTPYPAGAALPARITGPTAWKAFSFVFNDTAWSLSVDCWDPIRLDVNYGEDFQACLDGTTAFAFDARARGHISSRILDLAAAFTDADFRRRGIAPESLHPDFGGNDQALVAARSAIKVRIKGELEDRFDVSISTWVAKLNAVLAGERTSTQRQLEGFTGLDQVLPDKAIHKAIKYVFVTLQLRVAAHGEGLAVIGKPTLPGLRFCGQNAADREKAWSLVIRAVDAVVAAQLHDMPAVGESGDLERYLRHTIEARVLKDGSWGLIDLVLNPDRERLGLVLPDVRSAELQSLVDDQEHRLLPASPAASPAQLVSA